MEENSHGNTCARKWHMPKCESARGVEHRMPILTNQRSSLGAIAVALDSLTTPETGLQPRTVVRRSHRRDAHLGTLSLDDVLTQFNYDKETGVFTRAGSDKPCGTLCKKHGYIVVSVCGKQVRAHRLAWFMVAGKLPESDIDHIDGNRANNAWSNLRIATPSQNIANARLRKDTSSGYKGVTYHRATGKWLARIRVNYELIPIGYFLTPQAAHFAYWAEATRHFGHFAKPAQVWNESAASLWNELKALEVEMQKKRDEFERLAFVEVAR
jgi:hypothetical protein